MQGWTGGLGPQKSIYSTGQYIWMSLPLQPNSLALSFMASYLDHNHHKSNWYDIVWSDINPRCFHHFILLFLAVNSHREREVNQTTRDRYLGTCRQRKKERMNERKKGWVINSVLWSYNKRSSSVELPPPPPFTHIQCIFQPTRCFIKLVYWLTRNADHIGVNKNFCSCSDNMNKDIPEGLHKSQLSCCTFCDNNGFLESRSPNNGSFHL